MRMECPFCWQHYEIDEDDRDKDFVCVSCEQMFNGHEALILPDTRRSRLGPVIWGAVALLVVLTVMNFQLWREIRTQRAAMEKIALASNLAINPPRPELEPVELKVPPVEAKTPAAETPAVKPEAPSNPVAVTAAVAPVTPDANDERLRKLEEKLAELSAKYDALYRLSLDTIPKVEGHLEAVTQGLADVRKQNAVYRSLPERLTRLEQEVAKPRNNSAAK